MGRLGKLPVQIPEGVKIELEKDYIEVKGPKASLKRAIKRNVNVEVTDDGVVVKNKNNSKSSKTMQGTLRSHINNMVKGVSEGWSKKLEINGPGYRAEVQGKNKISLSLGYAHPVVIEAKDAQVEFSVEKNIVTVEGADKEAVGHYAALIRDARRANVYTGSGIKYTDEVVRRKAGKQAGTKD